LTPFHEYQYGGDFGIDHAFVTDTASTLYLGVFAGYQTTRREHREVGGARGNVDAPSAAIYGTWLHSSGFYADGVALGQYAQSDFSIRDGDGSRDSADYENFSLGVSLEIGWQFKLPHGFTLTPSASIAYTTVDGADYTTEHGIHADLDSTEVLRWGVSLTLAKAFTLSGGTTLQPSIRIGYDEQDSYGGSVLATLGSDTQKWRAATDGGRTSVGVGVSWQLSDSQQIHLDYEGSWGTRYDVPWNINAGWRVRF
jgi:outer membrane autotransporter protein